MASFKDIEDLRLRYASTIAACCGLQVSIEPAVCYAFDNHPEKLCHVWRGNAEQFRRLWFLSAGDGNFDTLKRSRWLCPGWLRGKLYREDRDAYRFVIEFGFGPTKIMENRILQHARADAGFGRFMERLMMPVDCE